MKKNLMETMLKVAARTVAPAIFASLGATLALVYPDGFAALCAQ